MRLIDLTGKTFGELTVIGYNASISNQRSWNAKCSCGNELVVTTHSLRRVKHPTTHCGCKDKRFSPKGESMFHRIFLTYIHGAESRHLSFELTQDQFRHLISLDCFYCGTPPNRVKKMTGSNGGYVYNGLDRIDPSKGYIEGNVVPCCSACNLAKHKMSYVEFKEWIRKLSDNMMSKEIRYAV